MQIMDDRERRALRHREQRTVAAKDPEYRKQLRVSEIFTRWFVHMHRNGFNSLDPERLHKATPFFLFYLDMGSEVDVEEFSLFRDSVNGRYETLQTLLSDLTGVIFYRTLGSGRSDNDYHFSENAERTAFLLLEHSFLEEYELKHVEAACAFGYEAYRRKDSIDEILRRIHVN